MKKSGAFVLLVVVFLFVQCTPEDGVENSDCVNVTLGGDVMMPDTRISMDVNGDLTWNDDDRIYMLDGCNEKPVKLSVKNVNTNGPKKRSYYCELYRYFGVADYIERVIYHQGRTTPTSKFLGRNYYYQSGELSMLKNNITAKAKIMAYKNNSNDYEFMHNVSANSLWTLQSTCTDGEKYIYYSSNKLSCFTCLSASFRKLPATGIFFTRYTLYSAKPHLSTCLMYFAFIPFFILSTCTPWEFLVVLRGIIEELITSNLSFSAQIATLISSVKNSIPTIGLTSE